MIKHIDELLEDWGSWTAGHVNQSAIGYPSSTVEGRAIDGLVSSGQPARSICPDCALPRRLRVIDRLMTHAPEKLRALAVLHYVERERCAGSWYWTKIDKLHFWIDGALTAKRIDQQTGR